MLEETTQPRIACPYCGGGITAQDQECHHCHASFKGADLLGKHNSLNSLTEVSSFLQADGRLWKGDRRPRSRFDSSAQDRPRRRGIW
jgi:hypothetical protein